MTILIGHITGRVLYDTMQNDGWHDGIVVSHTNVIPEQLFTTHYLGSRVEFASAKGTCGWNSRACKFAR